MTAQYYRPQRENRGRSRLLYATFLVIIIFLLDLVAGGRLKAAVRTSTSYVYVSFAHIGTTVGLTGYLSSHYALAHENADLKASLAEYHAKDAAYAAMLSENSQLRALANYAARTKGRTAAVVSAPSASPYGTFSIDIGSSGVARGSVVYTADGFAVGVVTDQGASSSLVTQIFAPDATVEATIGDTVVVLQGSGGGNARAQAPRDADLKRGDVVRAPQINAPIGVIEKVDAAPTGAYKEIYVRIPANLETLTFVYVAGK